jgi:hypothetical protein
MAYGLKYQTDFKTTQKDIDITWRLNIYLEGYVGSTSEMELGGKPVEIKWKNADQFEPIRNSTATVNIWNETEGQYSEFLTASYGDYMMTLVRNPATDNQIVWRGYNQSEIATEPFTTPPYNSSIQFTDGLSHLKYVRFEDTGVGTLYTGQKSVIEVLRLCLNQLDNPLGIRESVNVYEDNHNSATTDSPLNQTFVDSALYKEIKKKGSQNEDVGWFCNKVIKEILRPFKAHIYLYNDMWHIVRVQEYEGTTLLYRDFNANVGTESTITVDATGSYTSGYTITGVDKDNVNELAFIGADMEKEIVVPLNRVELTFKSNTMDFEGYNFIRNGTFERITFNPVPTPAATYSGFPTLWSESGGADTYNYQALSSDQNFAAQSTYDYQSQSNKNLFTFEPIEQATASAIDTDLYIQYEYPSVPTSTTDKVRFEFYTYARVDMDSLSWNNMPNNYLMSGLTITYELYIQLGTYYLVGDNIAGYTWSTTAGRCKYISNGGFNSINTSANNTNFSAVSWSKKLIKIETPNLPQNGVYSFTFRYYRPYHDIVAYDSTSSIDIDLGFLKSSLFGGFYIPANNVIVDDEIIYSEIDEDEEVYKETFFHADGNSILSQNSFRLSDTSLTDSWQRRGKTEAYSIMRIAIETFKDLRGDFIDGVSCKLVGDIAFYNALTYEVASVTTRYQQNNIKWDVSNMVYDVELLELDDFTTITPTISTSYNVLTHNANEGTIGGSAPYNPNNNSSSSSNLIVQPSTTVNTNQTNITNYP